MATNGKPLLHVLVDCSLILTSVVSHPLGQTNMGMKFVFLIGCLLFELNSSTTCTAPDPQKFPLRWKDKVRRATQSFHQRSPTLMCFFKHRRRSRLITACRTRQKHRIPIVSNITAGSPIVSANTKINQLNTNGTRRVVNASHALPM